MKSCLIIAGSGEIGRGIGRMAGHFKLAEAESSQGFHVYESNEPDAPNIAVLNMEELNPRNCAEKIQTLGHDHQLTLFCATDDDRIRMQQIFGHKLAIRAFDIGALCSQMSSANSKTDQKTSAGM